MMMVDNNAGSGWQFGGGADAADPAAAGSEAAVPATAAPPADPPPAPEPAEAGGVGHPDSYTVDTAPGGDLVHVFDFESGLDHLAFGAGPATPSNYTATMAGNEADALAQATTLITAGDADYVAVQVGDDTFVYADSHGTDSVDAAIILVGHRVTELGLSDFG